jgi:hypothetical protein
MNRVSNPEFRFLPLAVLLICFLWPSFVFCLLGIVSLVLERKLLTFLAAGIPNDHHGLL